MSGQTVKYNLKKRLGRGFTFEELKVMSPGSILHCMLPCEVFYAAGAIDMCSEECGLLHEVLDAEVLVVRKWPLQRGQCDAAEGVSAWVGCG